MTYQMQMNSSHYTSWLWLAELRESYTIEVEYNATSFYLVGFTCEQTLSHKET